MGIQGLKTLSFYITLFIKKLCKLRFKTDFNMKYLIILVLFLASCTNKTEDTKAKNILVNCVKAHGGAFYEDLNVSFDFRKYKVNIKQQASAYTYDRTYTDSTGTVIKDHLSNDVFERFVNGKKAVLNAKDIDKYKEATNSVAYFVLLPYKLLDKAVIANYIGDGIIQGQAYEKIRVTFDANGGGKDHGDVFCYWIHKQKHTLDYLAYTNGGPRFRKAKDRVSHKGVLFQNYDNYEILDKTAAPESYDEIYTSGKAKLLSEIIQSNYK